MTEEEARAKAAKRETHKRPGLSAKHWVAQEAGMDGSWEVVLVDQPWVSAKREADRSVEAARSAFRRGGMLGFIEAASQGVMARTRADIGRLAGSESKDPRP